jgi:hypothetical protein
MSAKLRTPKPTVTVESIPEWQPKRVAFHARQAVAVSGEFRRHEREHGMGNRSDDE